MATTTVFRIFKNVGRRLLLVILSIVRLHELWYVEKYALDSWREAGFIVILIPCGTLKYNEEIKHENT